MKRIGILASLLAVFTTFLMADQIDLTKSHTWVYEGYFIGNLDKLPEPDELGWYSFPPTSGKRPQLMRDMKFENVEPFNPLDPTRKPPVQMTMLIPFEADLILLNASDPALYLAHIGVNWEIYLNGNLLRSELYQTPSGEITRERSLRGELVVLDKRYLKFGRNVLAFRIFGDPNDDRTGFGRNGPYVIDRYEKLSARNNEYIDLMLIGIYAFFAVYHAILFGLRPRVKSYLYYGVSTLLLSLYLLAKTRTITALIPDTAIVSVIEYGALFLVLPAISWFLESTILGRVSVFSKVYAAVCVALVVPTFFLRQEPVLIVFFGLSAVAALHLLVSVFLGTMARSFAARMQETNESFWKRFVPAFVKSTVFHPAGQYLFFVTVFAVALVADAFVTSLGGVGMYSKYAYLVLVLGTAGILAFDFMGMWREAEELTDTLELKVEERTHALRDATEKQKTLNSDFADGNRRLSDAMAAAERDMKMAITVQRGFFPPKAPPVDGWDIAFESRPASGVSGDFYDFYTEGARLDGLIVGDVSGRGISSGLITVLARSIFFRGFKNGAGKPLPDIVDAANNDLVKELSAVDNFLTAVMLRFKGNDVDYVNAANADIIVRKKGSGKPAVVAPKDGSAYKGSQLGRDRLEARLRLLRFSLEPGDVLLVITDCIVENVGRAGRYGMERLLASFGGSTGATAREILDDILNDFKTYNAGHEIADDLTAMVLVRK